MALPIVKKLQRVCTSFPSTVGLFAYVSGLLWFALLSQDEMNHETYMSENALLVGQVVEKFDQVTRVRWYDSKLRQFHGDKDHTESLRTWLAEELNSIGLEVYEQNFTFTHPVLHPLDRVTGTNLYTILRSPSGGRLETLLLIVPLRTECSDTGGPPCLSASLSIVLPLLDMLRGQVYWAKDIVVIFPESDYVGLSAWLQAYHGFEPSEYVSWTELRGRSGAIQAGLSLEFSSVNVDSVDISSEGINGLLANLDLVNTAVRLAQKHAIEPVVNNQIYAYHRNDEGVRLRDAKGLLHAVISQAPGSPTGLHSLLIKYQIPAITLRGPVKDYSKYSRAPSTESLGRFLEGILRSLNNLQERFHQSFWNYLLPNPMRYISIGVYMPPVMVLISSLVIKLVAFWWLPEETKTGTKVDTKSIDEVGTKSTEQARLLHADQEVRKRKLSPRNEHSEQSKPTNKMTAPAPASPNSVPPTLGYLAIWVSLCFASGLALSRFPTVILLAYQHPTRWVLDQWLHVQPFVGEFLAVGLALFFALFVVPLPWVISLLQRSMFFLPSPPYRWTGSVILTAWALFLSCTAFLNVSASLLMATVLAPWLVLFVQPTRRSTWMSCMFGLSWLTVSPPFLILALTYLSQWSSKTPADPWTQVPQTLVQLLLEADLLGCWTWSALTTGFCTLWVLTWTDICRVH